MSDISRSRLPTTLDQSPQITGGSRQANTVHELHAQLKGLVGALPFGPGREARRRLAPVHTDAIEQLARRKMALAVEHEVTIFAQELDADRLTALVNIINVRADLRCILANILSRMATVLTEHKFRNEDRLDDIHSERLAQLEARHAAGRIDTQCYERRKATLQASIADLIDDTHVEIDHMLRSYRQQIREVIARASLDI